MKEREIRGLIEQVRSGEISRRSFVRGMMSVGLTAPMAGMMLAHSGVAHAQPTSGYKPTQAGGGGTLKVLQWQSATMLNPHLAVGLADQHSSSAFYEPLASWDEDGNLVPILAAEVPTLENGGLSEDGLTVTWKVKQGVTWHDGAPFTVDDCLFTAEFLADPEVSASTIKSYQGLTFERLDDFSFRLTFPKPTPFWADPFVGIAGAILPKHLFSEYKGVAAREAPMNMKPIGTGPYIVREFVPGDLVLADANPNYHEPNRPYFDALEIKGGGDAVSAARAVLQTGDYDFTWNLSIGDDILTSLSEGGAGEPVIVASALIEFISLNHTDPRTEVDGEYSSVATEHPAFKDKAVRQALSYLVDRKSIGDFIYGQAGVETGNFLVGPPRYVSENTGWEFNIQKAIDTLEAAGWSAGAGGVREKDGVKLSFLYQTSTNPQRQKTQAVVKQACAEAGIELELKAIAGSIYFSSDPGNPDTFTRFMADMEEYASPMQQPDPGNLMYNYHSSQVPTKANNYLLRNVPRYRNPEYDALWEQSAVELDPVKRAEQLIALNDMLVGDVAVVPVVARQFVAGKNLALVAPTTAWAGFLSLVKDWYIDA